MTHRFKQVDVFTDRPFFGNPVAVVLDADDIDPADMQRIAKWTNLSETTFVLRPTVAEADYRLRIFSPGGELPFAGHPTVGSAHAVLESGVVGSKACLTQECGAGLLPLTVEGSGPAREIFVQAPQPTYPADGELATSAEALSSALGAEVSSSVPMQVIDVGPVWLVAYAEDADALRNAAPDMTALAKLSRELGVTGVTVFSLGSKPAEPVHVRSFAPAVGVPEDPVCGSGNACVGAFLASTGMLEQTGTSYRASQGTELGRDGQVSVRVEDEGRRISIGGRAVTVIEGTVSV